MIGDLEKSCLVIWRNRGQRFGEIIRQFGEIVFGDLEKSCSAYLWQLRTGVCYEVAYSSTTISGC